MQKRTFHGNINPAMLADLLVTRFNNEHYRAQKLERDRQYVVQIASRSFEWGDPSTALTVGIGGADNAVVVTMSQQQWLGIAADLAQTGFMALLNPVSLISRIDNVARNVARLNLPKEVWQVIEQYCHSVGATKDLESLRVPCAYCGVPADASQDKCQACGAPLTEALPISCLLCGEVSVIQGARFCTNCGAPLDR